MIKKFIKTISINDYHNLILNKVPIQILPGSKCKGVAWNYYRISGVVCGDATQDWV